MCNRAISGMIRRPMLCSAGQIRGVSLPHASTSLDTGAYRLSSRALPGLVWRAPYVGQEPLLICQGPWISTRESDDEASSHPGAPVEIFATTTLLHPSVGRVPGPAIGGKRACLQKFGLEIAACCFQTARLCTTVPLACGLPHRLRSRLLQFRSAFHSLAAGPFPSTAARHSENITV